MKSAIKTLPTKAVIIEFRNYFYCTAVILEFRNYFYCTADTKFLTINYQYSDKRIAATVKGVENTPNGSIGTGFKIL
jgi:hypothetical protein